MNFSGQLPVELGPTAAGPQDIDTTAGSRVVESRGNKWEVTDAHPKVPKKRRSTKQARKMDASKDEARQQLHLAREKARDILLEGNDEEDEDPTKNDSSEPWELVLEMERSFHRMADLDKGEDFKSRIKPSRGRRWQALIAKHRSNHPEDTGLPSFHKLFVEDVAMLMEYGMEIKTGMEQKEAGKAVCVLLRSHVATD